MRPAALLLLLLARGLRSDPLPDVTSHELWSLEAASLEAEAGAEAAGAAGPGAEPPEGCCVRSPRMEPLNDGEGGSVDVGHCSRSCRRWGGDDVDSAEKGGGGGGGGGGEDEGCPGAWQCEASRVALRREAAAAGAEGGGVRELRVVEACGCRLRAAPCARRPLTLRVFPDTPFQRSIDVGACAGRCKHGGGCRAVHKRWAAVAGPNGAQCVPLVERCACAPSCFRVRRLEVVEDFSPAPGDDRLLSRPVVKEVDVGACEGGCDAAPTKGRRCADPFWRASSGAPCRSWLYESRAQRPGPGGAPERPPPACAAAETSTRRYTARDGERRRLVVVERCACR